jgi:hypothetical protein
MRKTWLAGAATLAIGGLAAGTMLAHAQPAPSRSETDPGMQTPGMQTPGMQGPGMQTPGMQMPGMQGHGMQGSGMPMMRMHEGHMAEAHRRHGPFGPFGLVFRQEDRQLTPPDVQKIAEAFLLWNGNHGWKVVEVAATPAGPIGFAIATPEGSVIARFTMDPHSGRLVRVG